MDIQNVSVLADYFVIATAQNPSQLQAMAYELEEKLYKAGMKMISSEGNGTSSWLLLNFGDIVAHLFLASDRDFYKLEKVWGDATVVDIES